MNTLVSKVVSIKGFTEKDVPVDGVALTGWVSIIEGRKIARLYSRRSGLPCRVEYRPA
jgi:hypothetical protein